MKITNECFKLNAVSKIYNIHFHILNAFDGKYGIHFSMRKKDFQILHVKIFEILTRKINLIFNVKTPEILYMYIPKCNFAAVWH